MLPGAEPTNTSEHSLPTRSELLALAAGVAAAGLVEVARWNQAGGNWFPAVWFGLAVLVSGGSLFLLRRSLPVWLMLGYAGAAAVSLWGSSPDWQTCGFVLGEYQVLALAACGYRPRCQRLAVAMGLFLVIGTSAWGLTPAGWAILGLFGLLALAWLLEDYWNEICRRVPLAHTTQATNQQRLPGAGRWAFWAVTILLTAGVLGAAGSSGLVSQVGLWQLAAASSNEPSPDQPPGRSGPVRSSADWQLEQLEFTDSPVSDVDQELPDRITLSETINQIFGRALQEMAEEESAQEVGEAFSIARRGPLRSRFRDRLPQEKPLLMVRGATPLYLRLAAFDQFDGTVWKDSGQRSEVPLRMEEVADARWLRVFQTPNRALLRDPHWHVVGIGRLQTARLPLANQTTLLRLADFAEKPDAAGRFERAAADLVTLQRNSLATGMLIELESYRLDPQGVLEHEEMLWPDWETVSRQRAAASPLDHELRTLAANWTAGVPPGWRQVQAVLARLRSEYTLDREAAPPRDCESPLRWFLLESRRGPDYLFATAASALLESLGYETRLIAGFYAPPDSYDAGGSTPLVRRDVHFWTEIKLGRRTWANLEPTPGYEIPQPDLSTGERLARDGERLAGWVATNWDLLLAGMLLAAAIAYFRRDLMAGAVWLLWRTWFAIGDDRGRVQGTLWLLERRAQLAGVPRPDGVPLDVWYRKLEQVPLAESDLHPLTSPKRKRGTPSIWHRFAGWVSKFPRLSLGIPRLRFGLVSVDSQRQSSLGSALAESGESLDMFLAQVEWLLYAPYESQTAGFPWAEETMKSACRQVAEAWTYRHLRSMGRR